MLCLNDCRWMFGIVLGIVLITSPPSLGDDAPNKVDIIMQTTIDSLSKMEQPDFSTYNLKNVGQYFRQFFDGFQLNAEKWRALEESIKKKSKNAVTIRECTKTERTSGLCQALPGIKGPAAYLVLENSKTGQKSALTFGPYDPPFVLSKEANSVNTHLDTCSWYVIQNKKTVIPKKQAEGPLFFQTNEGTGCEHIKGAAVPKSFCMGLIKCQNEKMPNPILRVCQNSGAATPSLASCPPAQECVLDKTFTTSNAAKDTKDNRVRQFNGPIRIHSKSKSGGSIIVAISARETASIIDGPTEYSYGAMVQPGFQEVLHGEAKPKEITFENFAADQCINVPTNLAGHPTPLSIDSYYKPKQGSRDSGSVEHMGAGDAGQ
jgi:hypothetical protein